MSRWFAHFVCLCSKIFFVQRESTRATHELRFATYLYPLQVWLWRFGLPSRLIMFLLVRQAPANTIVQNSTNSTTQTQHNSNRARCHLSIASYKTHTKLVYPIHFPLERRSHIQTVSLQPDVRRVSLCSGSFLLYPPFAIVKEYPPVIRLVGSG